MYARDQMVPLLEHSIDQIYSTYPNQSRRRIPQDYRFRYRYIDGVCWRTGWLGWPRNQESWPIIQILGEIEVQDV